jgi:L-lactate utilization protein LutB
MKKFLVPLLVISLMSGVCNAECNFQIDIVKNADGTRTYSKECHVAVGEMKQDLEIEVQKTDKLNKALNLKDLVIEKADQRADLWMNTAFKLEDRINKIDDMQSTNKWIAFGLGVVVTFGATYLATQALRH